MAVPHSILMLNNMNELQRSPPAIQTIAARSIFLRRQLVSSDETRSEFLIQTMLMSIPLRIFVGLPTLSMFATVSPWTPSSRYCISLGRYLVSAGAIASMANGNAVPMKGTSRGVLWVAGSDKNAMGPAPRGSPPPHRLYESRTIWPSGASLVAV